MKLTFFNHASIAIEDPLSRFAIITDPWVNSNAFGGWEQCPRPNQGAVEAYLDKLDKYALLISHGHDDHCDDVFIKNKLSPCQVFIPKYRSPGFRKRIENLCSNEAIITELEHGKAYTTQPFRLMATVNPDFTNNDSIIAIQDNKNTIIHANDNWHRQPNDILDLLNDFSSNTDTVYLAQIGIAGSFPMYYLGLNDAEKNDLITSQLNQQADSIEANSRAVHARRAFSYANESKFTYLDSSTWYSTGLRQNLLAKHVNDSSVYRGELANTIDFIDKDLQFCNLRNHCSCDAQGDSVRFSYFPVDQPRPKTLANHLSTLEGQINGYILEDGIHGHVKLVSFSSHEIKQVFSAGDVSVATLNHPTLSLFSTPEVWDSILSGDLNLESITIGGCGLLKKTPSTWNARFVHDALSRFAYRFQAKAKQMHLK